MLMLKVEFGDPFAPLPLDLHWTEVSLLPSCDITRPITRPISKYHKCHVRAPCTQGRSVAACPSQHFRQVKHPAPLQAACQSLWQFAAGWAQRCTKLYGHLGPCRFPLCKGPKRERRESHASLELKSTVYFYLLLGNKRRDEGVKSRLVQATREVTGPGSYCVSMHFALWQTK